MGKRVKEEVRSIVIGEGPRDSREEGKEEGLMVGTMFGSMVGTMIVG
jgi:hypothetical protein